MIFSRPSRPTAHLASKLLWVDCCGGLAVGCVVLAAHRWLAEWYQLPAGVLLAMGAANLIYGSYSLTLANRAKRPLWMIQGLAAANLAWAPVCFAIVAIFRTQISVLGMVVLIGEGLYVGGLGWLEWRLRHQLTRSAADVTAESLAEVPPQGP